MSISELSIRGERAFRYLGLYADLKRLLVSDGYQFRVPESGAAGFGADRVLFLNLTFWGAGDSSDVLADTMLDADVLAHAAWHHAARKALAADGPPTAAALFLGEAIASAFDVYLIGQMLRRGKQTDFLKTQLSVMTHAARGSGMSDEALAALFTGIAEGPDAAFESLRALLFEASVALSAVADLDAATAVLEGFSEHRFACLLHHYALSAWVLYAAAYAAPARAGDLALSVDQKLRAAPVALDWLTEHWLTERRC